MSVENGTSLSFIHGSVPPLSVLTCVILLPTHRSSAVRSLPETAGLSRAPRRIMSTFPLELRERERERELEKPELLV
ncbi:hypothetical protein VNO78_15753 [Psophocarpus tetragonolobus]|uniref:Uncharacterized protein n=1 Tax=Psophocarpus tetragonolobus TaxID=3891 RepID=A0AAN9XJW1_PSOTE